ncbi:MAG: TerC family protein [Acidimicrobiia bacterium]|nr:TerC family protein [Acidimicrobiia bacterium]
MLASTKVDPSRANYHVSGLLWSTVFIVLIIALCLDLFVFNRHEHEVSMKEAALASCLWIALGIAFGIHVYFDISSQAAGQYFAAYVLEKSLSVDNLFVIALLFSYFAVPKIYQHRVLYWGVIGALVLRGIFIALGAVLIARFEFVLAIFGIILLLSAYKMSFSSHDAVDPEKNPLLKLMRKRMKMTKHYQGKKFFIVSKGIRYATPLFAVLLIVETTDVVFAFDSIPAVFGISSDPFIVFSSNAFAILGLRSLYFLIAGLLGKFESLKYGLSFILAFIGVKLMAGYLFDWHPPEWLSLGVIAVSLGVSITYSILVPSKSVEIDEHLGEGLVDLDEAFDDAPEEEL